MAQAESKTYFHVYEQLSRLTTEPPEVDLKLPEAPKPKHSSKGFGLKLGVGLAFGGVVVAALVVGGVVLASKIKKGVV